MVQRGEHLRLAIEPREPLGVVRDRRQQHLDRDVAIQLGIARAIDLTHAARAEHGDDLVRSEAAADGE